jgi:hypothetical protein
MDGVVDCESNFALQKQINGGGVGWERLCAPFTAFLYFFFFL